MKKQQFSYMNGRALSHASLQRFRQQTPQLRMDLGNPSTININKKQKEDFLNSKPNVKYYVSNENKTNSSVAIKRTEVQKSEQQLKKRIKVLEHELKNKINENSHIAKLFKTKNSSEISHIDIYLQLRKMQTELEQRKRKSEKMEIQLQQRSKQIQQLLHTKEQQQNRHTFEIKNVIQKIQKMDKKHQMQLIQRQQERKERQKQIQQQRKSRQEKDILLRQIRKKYEETQRTIAGLQNQLQYQRESKSKLERVCQERIINNKQDYVLRIQQNNAQMHKLRLQLRETQEAVKQTHEKYTIRQLTLSKNLKQRENELQQKESSLKEKDTQIGQLQEKIKNMLVVQSNLNTQIKQIKSQLKQNKKQVHEKATQIVKNAQTYQNLLKQLNASKQMIKQQQNKNDKLTKQVHELQMKLKQISSQNRSIQYEKEEKQVIIDKLKSTIYDKDKKIEDKQRQYEQLESKLFSIQRKANGYTQRIKQLQKQFVNHNLNNHHRSKLEIQNYKCIGRLMELINQIRMLTLRKRDKEKDSQEYFVTKNKFNSNSSENNKNHEKNRIKPNQSPQPQSITQCIDILNKQMQAFIKFQYNQSMQENKNSKQLIQQIICDIKSIFHAYNSYIQDQQLKGATRQYLQCLDSEEKSIKKSRNNYLQVIMERLISMIAIQSYTSEKGLKRNQSKKKFSTKRNKDSLQNTSSNWSQNEENITKISYDSKNYLRKDNKKLLENNMDRYTRNQHSKRKSTAKLQTQPTQIEHYPIKRLQYGKQNIMQRINKNQYQIAHNKYNYLTEEQRNQKYVNNYIDQPKDLGYLKKLKNMRGKQPVIQPLEVKKEGKANLSDAQLIQKKYFR